jgi:hypothetical protein
MRIEYVRERGVQDTVAEHNRPETLFSVLGGLW